MADVKSFLFIVHLLYLASSFDAVMGGDYLPFNRYKDVYESLFRLTRGNACSQLLETKQMLERVITDAGLRPDASIPFCPDENNVHFCGILDGSQHAPMGGPAVPTLCRSYAKIQSCYQTECGDSGSKFGPGWNRGETMSNDADSCPKQAVTECIGPVEDTSTVDQDSCIAMARAKPCFVDKLNDCGGSSQGQLAVDIALTGVQRHIQKCKDKNIPFVKEGDICVPNPLDVHLSKDLLQQISVGLSSETTRDETFDKHCGPVEAAVKKLETLMTDCAMEGYVKDAVASAVHSMSEFRLHCMKRGYNLPCECAQNSGSKSSQGKCTMTIMMMVLSVALTTTAIDRLVQR